MNEVGWTDEKIERLKALWKDGHSSSEIASIMGIQTRGAVMSKLRRLGLCRAKPYQPK